MLSFSTQSALAVNSQYGTTIIIEMVYRQLFLYHKMYGDYQDIVTEIGRIKYLRYSFLHRSSNFRYCVVGDVAELNATLQLGMFHIFCFILKN